MLKIKPDFTILCVLVNSKKNPGIFFKYERTVYNVENVRVFEETMFKKIGLLAILILVPVFAAPAGEEKIAEEKGVLDLSKDDLKSGFDSASGFVEKMKFAYAIKKKKVKHKKAKEFLSDAFNGGFSELEGDVSLRLPGNTKDDKDYKVTCFKDVLMDVKACFALADDIREKRKKIEELKKEIKRLMDREGEAMGREDKSALQAAEDARRAKEKKVREIKAVIAGIQTRFKTVGFGRLKKASKSKDKLVSGFAKFAAKIMKKVLVKT